MLDCFLPGTRRTPPWAEPAPHAIPWGYRQSVSIDSFSPPVKPPATPFFQTPVHIHHALWKTMGVDVSTARSYDAAASQIHSTEEDASVGNSSAVRAGLRLPGTGWGVAAPTPSTPTTATGSGRQFSTNMKCSTKYVDR